jgi:hypothetical protein
MGPAALASPSTPQPTESGPQWTRTLARGRRWRPWPRTHARPQPLSLSLHLSLSRSDRGGGRHVDRCWRGPRARAGRRRARWSRWRRSAAARRFRRSCEGARTHTRVAVEHMRTATHAPSALAPQCLWGGPHCPRSHRAGRLELLQQVVNIGDLDARLAHGRVDHLRIR